MRTAHLLAHSFCPRPARVHGVGETLKSIEALHALFSLQGYEDTKRLPLLAYLRSCCCTGDAFVKTGHTMRPCFCRVHENPIVNGYRESLHADERVTPQHPRALGVGRRSSRGEQVEREDQ